MVEKQVIVYLLLNPAYCACPLVYDSFQTSKFIPVFTLLCSLKYSDEHYKKNY